MASKHGCHCGTVVRTNLYEGHALSLLIPESLTDLSSPEDQSASELLDRLVRESKVVAQCPTCGTLSVVDKEYQVKFFVPFKGQRSGTGEGDA
jgi:hypothetical protein